MMMVMVMVTMTMTMTMMMMMMIILWFIYIYICMIPSPPLANNFALSADFSIPFVDGESLPTMERTPAHRW